MEVAVASRAPDKRGRAWVVRVRVSTLEPMQDVSRHWTYDEANEERRRLLRN